MISKEGFFNLPCLCICNKLFLYSSGDLAQLVERLNGIQKVRGSTPLISTQFIAMKIDANINNSVTSDLKDIFQTNLNKIILYGSYARGEESVESDVDYLILTTLNDDEIKEYNKLIVDLSYKYLDKHNVLFSFVIINSNQFTKYSDTLPFYNNIVKEGTVVYG